jgi:hypothetical protein
VVVVLAKVVRLGIGKVYETPMWLIILGVSSIGG